MKTSENPQIAHTAQKNLGDLPTLKKYGLLPQSQATQADSSQEDSDSSDDHPQKPAPEAQTDKRPVQFLKGKACQAWIARNRLRLSSPSLAGREKTLKLRIGDYKSLTLVGADEFSCDWKNRAVDVNYKAGGKTSGDLVSLEIQ